MRIRSGQLICRHGHVQQFFRVEHAQDEEFASTIRSSGLRRRRPGRKLRQKRKRATSTVSGLASEDDPQGADFLSDFHDHEPYSRSTWFPGAGAYDVAKGHFHRLQCLQLLLRYQIHALHAHRHDLPPETEEVAREIWAMFVSMLPVSHFSPQPLIVATNEYRRINNIDRHTHTAETEHGTVPLYDPNVEVRGERARMLEWARRNRTAATPRGRGADLTDPNRILSAATATSTDTEAVDPDDLQDDPEDRLAALDPVFAQQRRAAASSAGEETDAALSQAEAEPSHSQPQSRAKRGANSGPSPYSYILLGTLPSTVAVLYLALVRLGVPVLLADLVSLISKHKLPYLEAVQYLPAELVSRVNSADVLVGGLDSPVVPSVTTLHMRASRIARLLHLNYAVSFPPPPVHAIASALAQRLALPPAFADAAARLVRFTRLEVSLEYRAPAARPSERYRDIIRVPREYVLAACLVVAIKMRNGTAPDPSWLEALETRTRTRTEQADLDVLDMTPVQIDAYLDFLTHSLVHPNHPLIYAWRKTNHVLPPNIPAPTPESGDGDTDTKPSTRPTPTLQDAELPADRYLLFHTAGQHDATLPLPYARLIEAVNAAVGIPPPERRLPIRDSESKVNPERGLGIQSVVEHIENLILAECMLRRRAASKAS